jgi:hypothetical protein
MEQTNSRNLIVLMLKKTHAAGVHELQNRRSSRSAQFVASGQKKSNPGHGISRVTN